MNNRLPLHISVSGVIYRYPATVWATSAKGFVYSLNFRNLSDVYLGLSKVCVCLSVCLKPQLLLHLSTDLDETWHKARWWCLDFFGSLILKSYGPWHLVFLTTFLHKYVLYILFWLPILSNNNSANYCDGYIFIDILDNTTRDPLSAVDTCVGFTNRRTYPLWTSLETWSTYLYPAVACALSAELRVVCAQSL
jgi:hypothetical protein